MLEREPPVTMLTAWLALNRAAHAGALLRCIDMPKNHLFKMRSWRPCKTNATAVGRVHSVHPSFGEAFYMRIFLAREEMWSAIDFKAIRMVDGIEHETCKAACAALGLLQDNDEWDGTMTEAARTQMGKSLRALFVYIVLNFQPTHTVPLIDSHAESMSEDFARDVTQTRRTRAPVDTARLARSILLLEIEGMLLRHDAELTLGKKHLPWLRPEERRDALQFLEAGLRAAHHRVGDV